ncbi:ubiquitin-like-specific protease 1D isoform X2 [Lotus japonicus]|uniref:ubiquitin-like-specific protease 1D isoform X2 n=1 Tax=Lotus japonicus TaxID=34305 RepID=UPI0025878DA0|nr:ubiquitin-like-specific protease 1D isoform X2 [Lotus japonicus]
MEEQQQQKRPLNIDWNSLIDNTPPAVLVVEPPMASDQPPHSASFGGGLDSLTDHQLRENIARRKNTYQNTGKNLPDGGAKLLSAIERFEEELSRREANPRPKKEQKKAEQAGVSYDLRHENVSSQAQPQSTFASCFMKKIKDDKQSNLKHCNSQIIRDDREPKGRKRQRSSSRQFPFQCPSSRSKRGYDDKISRATSAISLQKLDRHLSRRYPKGKDAFQTMQSDGSRSRNGQPIVLDDDDDDDDEPLILENTENKLSEYLKEAKIYFPSRDDPECVEICYKDTDCLAPEGYLSSTIMNFYIRYLQQQASLTNSSLSDYHFFNTYFYKKLKEAVSCKQSDRETIFVKFRRWWKGVNIFQKAYVLIPIHEDLHWSLIIICIPDKGDESGPIILHLDSLGLHSSQSVFDNIKSYLIEEKKYMDRDCVYSDVSIADRIWKCLSRRIEAQVITIVLHFTHQVPQQKNEYDCGLFVLYFIKRFMEEAPERLKKKDLDMFSKRWFRPEEASSLRVKIKKLLIEELQNSISHNCISESSPASSGNATEGVETAQDSLT